MVSSNDVHCSNVEVRCVSNANLSSHKSFDLEQKIEHAVFSTIQRQQNIDKLADASKQGHRLQHRISKEKADLANLINFLPVDVMLNLMMYWPTSFPLDLMMKMKQHQCVLRNRCWKSVLRGRG